MPGIDATWHTTTPAGECLPAAKTSFIGEHLAKRMMADFGLQVPRGILLEPGQSGDRGVENLSPPLALKIVSQDVLHKSDQGFVALGLRTREDLASALDRMRAAARDLGISVDGYLVEEMAAPGVELVVGGYEDGTFGPMIMVGFGGIYVEVFKDVTFRICPITRMDAEEMIDGLRSRPILDGIRGRPKVDREALIHLLLRVGGQGGIMTSADARIAELDLNPVIVGPAGVVVVDARVGVKSERSHA